VINAEQIAETSQEKTVYSLVGIVAIFAPAMVVLTLPRILSGELSVFMWVFLAAASSAPILWFYRRSLDLRISAGYIITLLAAFILYNSFRQGLFGVNTVALALLVVTIITLFEKYAVQTALIVVIVFLTIVGGVHFLTSIVAPDFDDPVSIVGAIFLRFLFMSMFILLYARNYDMYKRQAFIAELDSVRLQLLNEELETVLSENKILKELVSVCGYCGLVKDPEDEDKWSPMEEFIQKQTTLELSHGMCPECFDKNMKSFSRMKTQEHS
jgi:hypothetical protein